MYRFREGFSFFLANSHNGIRREDTGSRRDEFMPWLTYLVDVWDLLD
jgi:hypothetical protein